VDNQANKHEKSKDPGSVHGKQLLFIQDKPHTENDAAEYGD
jgi:hypothetical protein